MSLYTPSEHEGRIMDYLYIGDKQLAKNKDRLLELGITHIVNVTMDIRHYFQDHEDCTIQYHRCACHDTDIADLSPYFEEATTFVHQARQTGHNVLIHCQLGISRSATIACAYLIRYENKSLKEAYTIIKQARPQAKPKSNFLQQLIRWEKQCRSGTTTTGTLKTTPTATKTATTTPTTTTTTVTTARIPVTGEVSLTDTDGKEEKHATITSTEKDIPNAHVVTTTTTITTESDTASTTSTTTIESTESSTESSTSPATSSSTSTSISNTTTTTTTKRKAVGPQLPPHLTPSSSSSSSSSSNDDTDTSLVKRLKPDS